MPTFISKGGVLHPAKESVSLIYRGKVAIPRKDLPEGVTIPNSAEFLEPGQGFLYDGPDREALNVMFRENPDGSLIGSDFRNDPDFIQMTRTRGFNTVEDYLKSIGYDEAKETAKFNERASKVQSHEVSKRVEEIEVLAGGKDYAGAGADTVGGFGDATVKPPKKK